MAQQDRDEFVHRTLRACARDDNRDRVRCANPYRSSTHQPGLGQVSSERNYGYEYGRPSFPDDDTDDDSNSISTERQDEQWDPVGDFFHYFFSDHSQCCSLRESAHSGHGAGRPREIPDVTKHAHGRFPPDRCSLSEGRAFPRAADDLNWSSPDQDAKSATDSDRGCNSRAKGFSQARPAPTPRKRALAPPPAAAAALKWPGQGNLDNDGDFPPRLLGRGSGPDRKTRESEVVAMSATRKVQRPDARTLEWKWPPWCLASKEACVEVYVVDDETGEKAWVEGEPQTRVVDKDGRDAYLQVEYDWHGEWFVQDFEPQHVRRKGTKETVKELVTKAAEDGITGWPRSILRR